LLGRFFIISGGLFATYFETKSFHEVVSELNKNWAAITREVKTITATGSYNGRYEL